MRIDPSVFKKLEQLPKRDAKRILNAVREFSLNPYLGDIQKMKGEDNSWRRRIGSYRIFYKLFLRERVILVFHLERRTSTTY